MKQQIISKGFLTYALTNTSGRIYGYEDEAISDWSSEQSLYWSEVYVDSNMPLIVRRGTCVTGEDSEVLARMYRQSRINLNPKPLKPTNKVYQLEGLYGSRHGEIFSDIESVARFFEKRVQPSTMRFKADGDSEWRELNGRELRNLIEKAETRWFRFTVEKRVAFGQVVGMYYMLAERKLKTILL